MTQKDKVLNLLRNNVAGVTTQQFLEHYIPRFSARIKELREQGYDIRTERGRGACKTYRLYQVPVYPELQITSQVSQLRLA